MTSVMRRYQQPLMIVVTIVIIIAFTWFYNDTKMDQFGADKVASIHGRSLTVAEYQRIGRRLNVASHLQLFDFVQTLIGPARSEDEAREKFVFNSLVLDHEAKRLSITATTDEVVAAVQELPAFQTNGVYDSAKYNEFVQTVLTPNGFTAAQIEELVADHVRLEKLKALVGSTVKPAAAEVRAAFEMRHQKVDAAYVRLNKQEFLDAVKLEDADVQKLFEERKETLKSDEKRKVKVAAFTLPASEKPLEGRERMEALQKLADQAQEFSIAMAEKEADFDALAAKAGVTPVETPEFTRSEPPPELAASPQGSSIAFRLTEQEPNSDPFQAGNGYAVIQLSGITPPRPLTFEEAASRLTEQIKQERAQEAMDLRAAEIRSKIEAELKAGKSFAEAAEAAGVKAETFPTFSLAEPKFDAPYAREIITTSIELSPGQLSDFVPVHDGGLIVRVEKRLPVEEEKFIEQQAMIAGELAAGRREAAFQDWLKDRYAAAGIQGGRG